jgi:quinoprotein glucose dehydrogenase
VGGFVRLDSAVALGDHGVSHVEYTMTSPPAVVGDIIVVGSAVRTTARRDAATGAVRAYDVRSGQLRWSFDPIPRSPLHPAWDKWTPAAARATGGANVWSIISVDVDRDLVFLPTSSAAPDHYGGLRPGRNDFANSVIALRGSTGEFLWSFQAIHHDLWDYDIAAQPVLATVGTRAGHRAAVIVTSKAGMIFVLDRESGMPLLPIQERRVPSSDVPGEIAWPTQPFPVQTLQLHSTRLTTDSAFGVTHRRGPLVRGTASWTRCGLP